MKILKSVYLTEEEMQKIETIKKTYERKEKVKLSFSGVISLIVEKFKL